MSWTDMTEHPKAGRLRTEFDSEILVSTADCSERNRCFLKPNSISRHTRYAISFVMIFLYIHIYIPICSWSWLINWLCSGSEFYWRVGLSKSNRYIFDNCHPPQEVRNCSWDLSQITTFWVTGKEFSFGFCKLIIWSLRLSSSTSTS